jgi:DNA (cytosine-5)-methyltransferase 1
MIGAMKSLDPTSERLSRGALAVPGPTLVTRQAKRSEVNQPLSVVGLFAGIGGIELGLHQAGHRTALMCEIDAAAQRVLHARFPGITVLDDVREVDRLPTADLLAGGFPCQDLSQAGRTRGITGRNSGLVTELFRLLETCSPRWLLLENVPFMLHLDRGRAMRLLTDSLGDLGYSWAYRVIDARAFGLPQRRRRVILLASRSEDPRSVLFEPDAGEPTETDADGFACGFFWTEGLRGLGWAVDAVPTLKGGSTIGIPSPPAIWLRGRGIETPDVRDAERLQGFPDDWTQPAQIDLRRKSEGVRWKLIGNAVSVPVSRWVGERLLHPARHGAADGPPLRAGESWPLAAWGYDGVAFRAELSAWPVHAPYQHLKDFLQYPTKPLSERATAGFLSRARSGSLRFPDGFLSAVSEHLERMRETGVKGDRTTEQQTLVR